MGFVCHVEHPHKFISNYLASLKTPPELRLEAWNLANDRYFLQINYSWTKVMHFLFLLFGYAFNKGTLHLKFVFFKSYKKKVSFSLHIYIDSIHNYQKKKKKDSIHRCL